MSSTQETVEGAVPMPVPSRGPPILLPRDRPVALAGAPRSVAEATTPYHELDVARSPLVGDVMSTLLVTTGPTVHLGSAATLMRYHGISGLPVVQGTRLTGVLSEKDILRALAEHGGFSVAAEVIDHVLEPPSRDRLVRRARWKGLLDRMRVREAMTAPAITVTPDTTLDSALRWMLLKHIQRLPVVDRDHLVGIVTRGDILTSLEGNR